MSPPDAESSAAAAHHSRDAPLKVLLADDVRDLQALIALWLEEAGHRVTRASSGKEIVECVRKGTFDLLVTDILMPDGDGWDAIVEVHRLRPEIRILAISGGAREMPAHTVLRAARAAGAIGMLEKPFSRPQLLSAVAQVLAAK